MKPEAAKKRQERAPTPAFTNVSPTVPTQAEAGGRAGLVSRHLESARPLPGDTQASPWLQETHRRRTAMAGRCGRSLWTAPVPRGPASGSWRT